MKRRYWLYVLIALILIVFGSSLLMLNQGQMNSEIRSTRVAIDATNNEVYRQITLTVVRKTAAPATSSPPPSDAGDVRVRAQVEAQPTPMIIRNAELSLVVADVRGVLDDITTMAGQMGGWVVRSGTRRPSWATNDQMVEASIVIRVPSVRFDAALESIRRGALSITAEAIIGQDVSEEYTDLVSTLRNLEAAEAQLQEIMDSATNTDDVLDVFEELRRVRGEIEMARGRMQYLEQAAAFSLISVALSPDVPPTPTPTPWPTRTPTPSWDLAPEIQRAAVNLDHAFQELVRLLIWLVVFVLPLAVVLGVPGILLYRLWRRLVRKASHEEDEKSEGVTN